MLKRSSKLFLSMAVVGSILATGSSALAADKPNDRIGREADSSVTPTREAGETRDYSYHYDYPISPTLSPFYTPEMVMKGAAETFVGTPSKPRTFPISADCGSWSELPSAGWSCSLWFANVRNPVKVVEVTSTSFTLMALPGHTEGAGRYIKFSFHQNSMSQHTLHVHSWGPWSLSAEATVLSGTANQFWSTYADKLKERIAAGTL